MGFTAVDGLPMGTRTGALDPGVVLYCIQSTAWTPAAIERLLYKESGLLGVSGHQQRYARPARQRRSAGGGGRGFVRLSYRQAGGALAAALGGLDALVFTAGIGEHAAGDPRTGLPPGRLAGIELDPEANRRGGPRISTADSPVGAWVIPTNEELLVARETQQLLAGAPA